MNDKWFRVSLGGACGLLCAMDAAAFDPASETKETAPDKVQKIRFKEDDAQNYMVSKVYDLKHLKANDLVPFVLGAVKRYASNSTVDRINYTSAKQMIVVTTGVRMMPYVDDMIAKLDRPSAKRGPFGSLLDGTGIQRYVYTPKFRSSQEIVDLLKYSNRKYRQTLIVITHDENIALQADRIMAIEDGHITRDEVLRR